MGPGHYGQGGRRGGCSRTWGGEQCDNVRSVRVGEVPLFMDHTDPKVYRRLLYDWIRFQDLADPRSSKKLTLGQQVFSIVSNIQGSAGHRLSHISGMVHAGLSQEEFSDIVDYILEVVDPVDRESAFLETAKAWKDMMSKGHGSEQSYDSYWSEYSSLCVRYAYSHGKVAQSPGVQELTALLCVLNARLDKTEFSMVLQAAMQYQSTLKDRADKDAMRKRSGRMVAGPMSAREVLRQVSHPRGEDQVEATSISCAVVAQGGASGAQESPVGVAELLATVKVDVEDNEKRFDAIQGLLSEVIEELDDSEDASVISKLKNARIKLVAAQDATKSCGKVADELSTMRLGKSKEEPVAQQGGSCDAEHEPMITMEAVRVALCRLDFGEKALADRPKQSQDYRDGKAMARSMLSEKVKKKTNKECWICGGDHYAYQNTACASELRRRRDSSEHENKGEEEVAQTRYEDIAGGATTGLAWAE